MSKVWDSPAILVNMLLNLTVKGYHHPQLRYIHLHSNTSKLPGTYQNHAGHATMPKLKIIQVGTAKVHALRSPDHKDTRLPITLDILRKIRAVWSSRGREHDVIMVLAACTRTFFRFFRLGEVTMWSEADFNPSKHLLAQDIAIDSRENPSLMKVLLKVSKTDQLWKGIYIGKTRHDLNATLGSYIVELCVLGNDRYPARIYCACTAWISMHYTTWISMHYTT